MRHLALNGFHPIGQGTVAARHAIYLATQRGNVGTEIFVKWRAGQFRYLPHPQLERGQAAVGARGRAICIVIPEPPRHIPGERADRRLIRPGTIIRIDGISAGTCRPARSRFGYPTDQILDRVLQLPSFNAFEHRMR
jgi:hypothetical protein